VPDVAYGLSCDGHTCFALAADKGPPNELFGVEVPDRASAWRAPTEDSGAAGPPAVRGVATLTTGPRIARVQASSSVGPGALAWVTYFLEGATSLEQAPKGEPPFRATLALSWLDATNKSGEATPIVISKRAVSAGGVGIASPRGKGEGKELVVSWVAADKTGDQVYVTKVDTTGKKVAQKKVTTVDRKKAKTKDKSKDIAEADTAAASAVIAWSDAPGSGRTAAGKDESSHVGTAGYVVAWVDGRDGNGEIYTARINQDLEKIVVDHRVTKSDGDASDVSLLVRANDAFVAFADARDGGSSDIYVTRIDPYSLRVLDADVRVYASAGPSRAPELVQVGDQVLLAWIEDPKEGSGESASLRVGRIDDLGRLAGAPAVLRAPDGGAISGFTLRCTGKDVSSCRGAISWVQKNAQHPEVGGFTLSAQAMPSAIVPVGRLLSAPFADPSLTFSPDQTRLYFAEDIAADRGRIRAIDLGW
jgi:hypothetical protein